MKKINKTLIDSIIFLCVTALLVGFLGLVDPQGRPLTIIFLPVLLFWVCGIFLVRIVVRQFLRNKKHYRYIGYAGLSIFMLLVLLSGVGQLQVADIILLVTLSAVMVFYFYRSWS
jgi:CDP-diglyceride synthetase